MKKSSFFSAARAGGLILLAVAAALLTTPRNRARKSGNYRDKADAEFDSGKYQPAADDYDKGLKLDPNHPGVWGDLGSCYLTLHRYEDAIAAFKKEISVAGSDSIAHEGYDGLGEAYAAMKRYQKALDAYDHAIKIDPDDAEAYEGRFQAYKALGESARTEQD